MFYTLKVLLYIEVLLVAAIMVFSLCVPRNDGRAINPLDVLIVLATPVVALLSGNKFVLFGYFFLVPILSAGDPIKMGQRYLFLLLSTPFLAMPYSIGSFYVGTISATVFLNLGLLVGLAFARRKARSVNWGIDGAAWGILLVAIVVACRGETVGATIRESALSAALLLPPFYLATRLPRSTDDVADLLRFFVLGAFCNSVVGMFEAVRHWPLYESMYDRLQIPLPGLLSAVLAVRAGFLRAGGAVSNYEVLGLVCALALIAVAGTWRRYTPTGRWIVIGIVTLGLLSSQARSAWLAAVIGLPLFLVASRKWKMAFGLTACFVAGGAGLYALSFVNERVKSLIGLSGHALGTVDYRVRLANRGFEEFLKYPLFGQTKKSIEISMNDLRQGEHIIDFVNAHLVTALMGGIVLLAIWLAAWVVPLYSGWRHRTRSLRQGEQPTVAVPIGMVAACGSYLLLTSTIDRVFPLVMLSFALTGSLTILASRRLAPRAAPMRRDPDPVMTLRPQLSA